MILELNSPEIHDHSIQTFLLQRKPRVFGWRILLKSHEFPNESLFDRDFPLDFYFLDVLIRFVVHRIKELLMIMKET